MEGINWGNNNINPYAYIQPIQPPHMEVIKVNGENGANAFLVGPNSSALLLDTSDPIIWFVQTDGAGYKTVTPYDIVAHVAKPPQEVIDLTSKLDALDKRIQAIEEVIKDESDT